MGDDYMKDLSNERLMTIKEVAEVLKVSTRTLQLKTKELFPEKVQNGKTTYLNEFEVTAIKIDLEKKFEVQTELEEDLLIEKALILQRQKIIKQQAQIEEMKPKALFYDTVTQSEDTFSIREVAAIINMKGLGQNNLFKYLRDNNIFMSDNLPYRRFIEAGYFKTVETTNTDKYGKTHVNKKPVVYQKGIDYLNKLLNKS